jgi:hypothetical protein
MRQARVGVSPVFEVVEHVVAAEAKVQRGVAEGDVHHGLAVGEQAEVVGWTAAIILLNYVLKVLIP